MGNATPEAIGLGFGLVIIAGSCTALGALLAFCTKISDTKILAGALGLSSGVMLYVSFVEIFSVKCINGFLDAGYDKHVARRYATFTFFGGMVLIWLLDKLCHLIAYLAGLCGRGSSKKVTSQPTGAGVAAGGAIADTASQPSSPAAALGTPAPLPLQRGNDMEACSLLEAGASSCEQPTAGKPEEASDMIKRVLEIEGDDSLIDAGSTQLARTGVLSALAIGIHNFPEGLATFVGTLAEPSAGVAIAFATALHNIPEGVVVAMPIYYATGSKLRGFLWAVLSGMSEPIGALLGYLILRGNDMHPMAYGILFGLVAGLMVFISVHELIPTALKYDPEDRWTTRCALLGMVIMAGSLLLFEL